MTGFCNISGGPSEIPNMLAPEPLDWWLSWAGAKKSWNKQEGTPPDGILGSLLDQYSNSPVGQPQPDSLEGQANSPGMATD